MVYNRRKIRRSPMEPRVILGDVLVARMENSVVGENPQTHTVYRLKCVVSEGLCYFGPVKLPELRHETGVLFKSKSAASSPNWEETHAET